MYASQSMEQRVNFRMPAELVKRFDDTVASELKKRGRKWPPMNRSTIVRKLIEQWCDDHKPTPPRAKGSKAKPRSKKRRKKAPKSRRPGTTRRNATRGR